MMKKEKLGRPPKVTPPQRSAMIAARESGLSISEIGRLHGMSRDTVRRALRETPPPTP